MKLFSLRAVRFPGLFLIGLAACSVVFAKKPMPASRLERVEWTWAESPVSYDPNLRNVLLVGDSISRNYYAAVATDLAGKANCFIFAVSATVGDPRLERELANYFADSRTNFSVVHINNGMHGWAYSESEYANALPDFLAAIRTGAPKAALIWALTTPVQKAAEGGASIERIEARNALVTALARANKIPIDDQFSLMLSQDKLHSDPIHYNAEGSTLQAHKVAAAITALLRGNN